ncbi:MAG: HU family DNA-binding protein [Candidatus Margulisbacteria bacterium]|nr:HU family DNA-binding protein [Candidatus Margulisiibacteriota bacterium]
MNKKVLIDKVTEYIDLKKSDVKKVVELVFDEITKELAKQKEVSIVGFGTFEVRGKPARLGTNPITHKHIQVPESVYIGFKMGHGLKSELRSNRAKVRKV